MDVQPAAAVVTTPKQVMVPVKQAMAYDAIVRGLRSAAAQAFMAALLQTFGTVSFAAFLPPPANFIVPMLFGGATVNALAKFARDKFGWDWLPL